MLVLKLQGLILWMIRMLKWIRKSKYITAVELFCDKFYSAVEMCRYTCRSLSGHDVNYFPAGNKV